jgi:hypothetical protein
MGLLTRIKDKVKAGISAVSEEAKHPGRPPGHKVQQNPFHRDEASRLAAEAADKARKKNAGDDQPWYLDGQNDGWDDTNPNGDKK